MTNKKANIRFRQFWGVNKREDLLASLENPNFDAAYEQITPIAANQFLLRPGTATADYTQWPSLPELSAIQPLNGLMEKRGGALIDADRSALEARIQIYLDPDKPMEDVRAVAPGLADDRAAFKAKSARRAIIGKGYDERQLRRYWLRPFDIVWAYTDLTPSVWNRSRPDLQHVLPEATGFLISRAQGVANPEGFPTCWTPHLTDDHGLRTDAFVWPIIENLSGAARPNLSQKILDWLASISIAVNAQTPSQVWHHALAITYSPEYLTEHADGIRQGFPRIPLPNDASLLGRSAALGAQIAALLDPDTPVDGVTHGTIRPELAAIAVPHGHDYALTAGWGNRTNNGVTMPGRGTSTLRPYTQAEAATANHAALLGESTMDIHLNALSYWANIPKQVWETHIGGYQVIKKWLSYREQSITNRPLTANEVEHVMQTARRLAAILLLTPELNESYKTCAQAHHIPL